MFFLNPTLSDFSSTGREEDRRTNQTGWQGSLSPNHFSNHFNATVWWSRHLDKSVFNFTRRPSFPQKVVSPLTSVATSQNWAFVLIISLVVTKSDSDHREMFHLRKVTFSTALSEWEMVTCDNSGRLMRGLGCKWNNFGRFMERGRNWPNYDKSMWEVTPI